MLPLEGITVVALEQAVAAPFASRQLADLGARVIKIERTDGGDFARSYDQTVHGMSSHFVWLNRSKESITLDLKQTEAQEILRRLLSHADVFIHNLAPGAVERMGSGAVHLRHAYPRLIICQISGYGASGPYQHKKAYDLLVQCETGVLSVTGTPDHPSKVGISIADISAGMYAYTGVLTALYQRERTGEGASFEVSLFESLGECMGHPAYFTAYGGTAPPRTGSHHATIAPYGPFATGGGQVVFLGLQNEREWVRFCESVLNRPDLANEERFDSNQGRVQHRVELESIIAETFSRLSAEEVLARLDAAEIANAQQRTPQEFWDHPQLAARNRWREVDSPVGMLRALLPPVTMDGVEPRMARIPAVGEETEGILEWLGYDAEQRAALRAASAI